MPRKSPLSFLLLGLLAGAAIGSLVTWQCYSRFGQKNAGEAPVVFEDVPEFWLFQPGFSLEKALDEDPALLEAMLDPDAMRIHLAADAGTLAVGSWKFLPEGVAPDEDTTARLKWALGSVSSYEPGGKMCAFHPDVLLRLEKNGRTHDIVFCFTCRQTTAGLDISPQGKRTFLKCFCDALPDAAGLHKMREEFEGRRW